MTECRPGQKQEGFVLIVVLTTVLALCALLVGFSQTTRLSLSKADSFSRTEQAWSAAWGGLQMALALVRDANDAGLDPQLMNVLGAERTFAVGDANCAIAITEENGRLNINRLITAQGQPDRRHVEQLLRLIDALNRENKEATPLSYGLAPAFIDWIDMDDEVACLPFVQHDNLGAESDYYQTLQPPYGCRNESVSMLEELACVKGMTSEAFERLRPYLTTVGDGKIDFNAAPREVLQSLSEQMDPALAEMIVRQRKLQPFRSLSEVRNVPGMTDDVCRDLQSLATTSPEQRFYRVTVQGRLQSHHCTIEALLQKNPRAQTVDILQYREL
jgi:general secretion pathway protein K